MGEGGVAGREHITLREIGGKELISMLEAGVSSNAWLLLVRRTCLCFPLPGASLRTTTYPTSSEACFTRHPASPAPRLAPALLQL